MTSANSEELKHFAKQGHSPKFDAATEDPHGRTWCWCAVITLAVLTVTGTVCGGIFGYRALDHSGDIDVTFGNTSAAFAASLVIWPLLVLPYSLVALGIPYFFDYFPGLVMVYSNVVLGISSTFFCFRWLSTRSHWVSRFENFFPNYSSYVKGLRQVFLDKGGTLSAIAMWGPLPIPLMVALVGLLTEAEVTKFIVFASLSVSVYITPLSCMAASVDSINDAKDDPVALVMLLVGVVAFVLFSALVAHYTGRTLEKYSDKEHDTECELRREANGDSYLSLQPQVEAKPQRIGAIFNGEENYSHPAI